MIDGARPWKIMYEVKVKLIKLLDTFRSRAKEFNAGKYICPDTGEKKPAHDAMKTMNLFWFVVKMECGGPVTVLTSSIGRSWPAEVGRPLSISSEAAVVLV